MSVSNNIQSKLSAGDAKWGDVDNVPKCSCLSCVLALSYPRLRPSDNDDEDGDDDDGEKCWENQVSRNFQDKKKIRFG